MSGSAGRGSSGLEVCAGVRQSGKLQRRLKLRHAACRVLSYLHADVLGSTDRLIGVLGEVTTRPGD
jgi:hypothetical protein